MASSGALPHRTLPSNAKEDGHMAATSEFPSSKRPVASGDMARVEEKILALIDGSEEAQVALCDLSTLFQKIYSRPLMSKLIGHATVDGLLSEFSSMIVRSGEGGEYVCRSCRGMDISDMTSVAMSAAIYLRQTKSHRNILNVLRRNPNGISCNQLTEEVKKLGDIIAVSAKEHGKVFISPALVLQHSEGVKIERIGGRRLLFLDDSFGTANPSAIEKAALTPNSMAVLEFLSLLQNHFRDRPWPATGKEMNRFFHSEIDLSMSPKLMAWVRSTVEGKHEGHQRKEALKQLMSQLKRCGFMGGTNKALSWNLEVVGDTLARHYHDSVGDRIPPVAADASAPVESSSSELLHNISATISASEDGAASAVGSGSCSADSRATLEIPNDKEKNVASRSRGESRAVGSPIPKTQSEDRSDAGVEEGYRCNHVGRGGRRSHEDAEIKLGEPSSRARVAIIGGKAIVKYAMIHSHHKGMCRLALDKEDLFYLCCTRGCPRFNLSHQMEEYLWCRRRTKKTLGLLSASVPLDAQSFIIFDHTAKTCGIHSNTNVTHLTLMEGYSVPQKTHKTDYASWLQYTTKTLKELRATMRLNPQIRIECLRKVPKLSDKYSVLVVANISMSFNDEELAKRLLVKCKLPQFPPHLAVGACPSYAADNVLDLASQRLVGLELTLDVDFLAMLAPSETGKFAPNYLNGGAKKTKKMEKSEAVLRGAVASAAHAASEINRALYESLVDSCKLSEEDLTY